MSIQVNYNNRKRLCPVIKFSKEGKGLLRSATTRRDGIIGNLDVGVDILSEFNLSNELALGRVFTLVDRDDNISFISDEYEKMVSINNIRSTVVNTFVGIVSTS